MVVANNSISLREIQNHIIADNTIFDNIHQSGLPTLDSVLQHNQVWMKQVYRVPFERTQRELKNSYEYVQILHCEFTGLSALYRHITVL